MPSFGDMSALANAGPLLQTVSLPLPVTTINMSLSSTNTSQNTLGAALHVHQGSLKSGLEVFFQVIGPTHVAIMICLLTYCIGPWCCTRTQPQPPSFPPHVCAHARVRACMRVRVCVPLAIHHPLSLPLAHPTAKSFLCGSVHSRRGSTCVRDPSCNWASMRKSKTGPSRMSR